MDKKLIRCLFAAVLFFMGSCRNNHEYKAECAEVDSIIHALNKSLKDVEVAPYEEAEEADTKARTLLAEIQKLVHDTLSRNAAILIGQYANITLSEEDDEGKEKSEFSKKEKEYIIKELKYSVNQLQNLKHDLQTENMPPETFKKHLANERKASERIIQVAEIKQLRWKQMVHLSDSLGPAILLLKDSLSNSKK